MGWSIFAVVVAVLFGCGFGIYVSLRMALRKSLRTMPGRDTQRLIGASHTVSFIRGHIQAQKLDVQGVEALLDLIDEDIVRQIEQIGTGIAVDAMREDAS